MTSRPSGDKISNKRLFVDAGPGTPDGMRADIDGNLWCGWGMGDPELDGVVVFAPDGAQIGRIALPERCANLCFGGLKRNRLFMAASQSIYALYVNTQGALGDRLDAASIQAVVPAKAGTHTPRPCLCGVTAFFNNRRPVIMGPCAQGRHRVCWSAPAKRKTPERDAIPLRRFY